jgi:uncharacterized iron-regulated membrane protein
MPMDPEQRKRRAWILRISRKIHRTTGAFLFVFFFITAITGLLLGWKKHSGGLLLPVSHKGKSTDAKDWLPIHVLTERSHEIVRSQVSPDQSLELDRIDVRPDKGMVKFVYIDDYLGVQLDLATGELLHIENRRSDLIENIHDGSYVDYLLGTDNGQFKLAYTTIMGTALVTFTVTGFWLWFGPKQFRRRRL